MILFLMLTFNEDFFPCRMKSHFHRILPVRVFWMGKGCFLLNNFRMKVVVDSWKVQIFEERVCSSAEGDFPDEVEKDECSDPLKGGTPLKGSPPLKGVRMKGSVCFRIFFLQSGDFPDGVEMAPLKGCIPLKGSPPLKGETPLKGVRMKGWVCFRTFCLPLGDFLVEVEKVPLKGCTPLKGLAECVHSNSCPLCRVDLTAHSPVDPVCTLLSDSLKKQVRSIPELDGQMKPGCDPIHRMVCLARALFGDY
jgi:hypothetical protein